MIVYKLKDIIDSQYNRPDEKRHQRSILFLIENVKTGGQSVFRLYFQNICLIKFVSLRAFE